MPHEHGMRCRTEIELYRMRRTLARVVRNLEEALHLSRHRGGITDERQTATNRHR